MPEFVKANRTRDITANSESQSIVMGIPEIQDHSSDVGATIPDLGLGVLVKLEIRFLLPRLAAAAGE